MTDIVSNFYSLLLGLLCDVKYKTFRFLKKKKKNYFMGMGLLGGSGCVGLVVCGGEIGVVWVCIIRFGRGCDGFGNW